MSEYSLSWGLLAVSETSTRDQIVTATRKLIEDRGIAHITSKQIAQTAGCAEGTIFPHFARKEDLLLAAVLPNFPSLREALMSISGGTPGELCVDRMLPHFRISHLRSCAAIPTRQ